MATKSYTNQIYVTIKNLLKDPITAIQNSDRATIQFPWLKTLESIQSTTIVFATVSYGVYINDAMVWNLPNLPGKTGDYKIGIIFLQTENQFDFAGVCIAKNTYQAISASSFY